MKSKKVRNQKKTKKQNKSRKKYNKNIFKHSKFVKNIETKLQLNFLDKAKIKSNIKYDYKKIRFLEKDIIGEGAYSKVYKFRYNNLPVDSKYVVKKIKVKYLKSFYGDDALEQLKKIFINELKALIHLSKINVSPKIYGYYIDIKHDHMFYILEKLDLTLGDMLRKGQFKPEQTNQFIELFERLIRSKYRHTDLHVENVMYDKKRKIFLLIDFGHHIKLSKHDKNGLYYTIESNSPVYFLISKNKQTKQAVLGTAGASALFYVYKYLANNTLNLDKKSFYYFKKLKQFMKKYLSEKQYNKVISILDKEINY